MKERNKTNENKLTVKAVNTIMSENIERVVFVIYLHSLVLRLLLQAIPPSNHNNFFKAILSKRYFCLKLILLLKVKSKKRKLWTSTFRKKRIILFPRLASCGRDDDEGGHHFISKTFQDRMFFLKK